MPETDTPLKLLVQTFAVDYAAWLLDTPPETIETVQPVNTEL